MSYSDRTFPPPFFSNLNRRMLPGPYNVQLTSLIHLPGSSGDRPRVVHQDFWNRKHAGWHMDWFRGRNTIALFEFLLRSNRGSAFEKSIVLTVSDWIEGVSRLLSQKLARTFRKLRALHLVTLRVWLQRHHQYFPSSERCILAKA